MDILNSENKSKCNALVANIFLCIFRLLDLDNFHLGGNGKKNCFKVKCEIPVNPFKLQYQYAYSPYCSPYISYGTSWENLHKHEDIACLVIISFILVTCVFDQVGILLGEIRCFSLLWLKGSTTFYDDGRNAHIVLISLSLMSKICTLQPL